MNIKEVALRTGLTKRAVKYYEDFGMIKPHKNEENLYREYSEEHVIKLNLIAALRMLNIPLEDIKEILEGKRQFNEVMKSSLETLSKLSEDFKEYIEGLSAMIKRTNEAFIKETGSDVDTYFRNNFGK